MNARRLFSSLLLLTACTQNREPLEEVTTTRLTSAGGQAASAAGELRLEFAQGSVDVETVITIRTIRGGDYLSPVFTIAAEPATSAFDPTARAELRSDAAARLIDLDRAEEDLASRYDELTHLLSAAVARPGRYAAAAAGACPPSPPSGACTAAGLRCPYGQECCCGQCYAEREYTCDGQSWSYVFLDRCLGAQCMDGGADGGEACGGNELCIESCGSDIAQPATCQNGQWTCPPGYHPFSQQETLCVGQLSGRCASGNTCAPGTACAVDGRCWLVCPGSVGQEGLCRVATSTSAGCCEPTPIDALCRVHVGLLCPLGTVDATTCTSTSTGC